MDRPFTIDDDRAEKVRYQSAELPLYVTRAWLSQCDDLLGVGHWHTDLEFVVVLQGQLDYNVNGQRLTLEAGEGIFVNSRQMHASAYAAGRADAEFICILLHPILLCASPHIEQRWIAPLIGNTAFSHLHLKPETDWQRSLLDTLRQARRIYEEQPPCLELELEGCYFHLAALLCSHMPAQGTPCSADHHLAQLRQMTAYIQRHLTEHIALADIAAAGSVCTSSCCHLFRQYLHQTPMEHVTNARLMQGRKLLRETSLSITEIALQAGFSGSCYFTERFRRAYGQTPTAYRAAQQKEG